MLSSQLSLEDSGGTIDHASWLPNLRAEETLHHQLRGIHFLALTAWAAHGLSLLLLLQKNKMLLCRKLQTYTISNLLKHTDEVPPGSAQCLTETLMVFSILITIVSLLGWGPINRGSRAMSDWHCAVVKSQSWPSNWHTVPDQLLGVTSLVEIIPEGSTWSLLPVDPFQTHPLPFLSWPEISES